MNVPIYIFLNFFLNSNVVRLTLSVILLLSLPVAVDFWVFSQYLIPHFGAPLSLILEFGSSLLGYVIFLFSLSSYTLKAGEVYDLNKIYRLIGSLPGVFFLLIPGGVSFLFGLIFLVFFVSYPTGRFLVYFFHLDTQIIFHMIQLSQNRNLPKS